MVFAAPPWTSLAAATRSGQVASRLDRFTSRLRDGRWYNCGVKQSVSGWPPSKLLCAQTQPNRNRRGVDSGPVRPTTAVDDKSATFPLPVQLRPAAQSREGISVSIAQKIHCRYGASCLRLVWWCSRLAVVRSSHNWDHYRTFCAAPCAKSLHQDPRGTTQLPSMKLPRGQRP